MKIEIDYLQRFYGVLESIGEKFPIDIETIQSVIADKLKMAFPTSENGAMFIASTPLICRLCSPNVAFISVTAPPNHLSTHVGLLQLKIVDFRIKSTQFPFIASTWLSMFPSGRMVFGMSDVNLDSSGNDLRLNEHLVMIDHHHKGDHQLIQILRKEMVEAVKSEKVEVINLKTRILKIFDTKLNIESN